MNLKNCVLFINVIGGSSFVNQGKPIFVSHD